MEQITHPMAHASLIEVLDYAALRMTDVRPCREMEQAMARFDEAYMWTIAALEAQRGKVR